MATQDISRSAFDPRKHYRGVHMQQGRIIVDDDWNERESIGGEDRRRDLAQVVGPHGTSDDGFEIGGFAVAGGQLDFTIAAGSYHVGGLRAELEGQQRFRQQDDWLQQSAADRAAPAGARVDLAYLEVWEQPVTAVEDGELLEVALQGADTSTRLRTMSRVRLATGVGTEDCPSAWQTALAAFAAARRGGLSADHELVRSVELSVGYAAGGNLDDLCSPAVAGGYLGAENQAIRVQLTQPDRLTWGFDNASRLYRVTLSGAGNRTVTLLGDPRDPTEWPLAGQTVELLPWAAVLPNGEKVAAWSGQIDTVASSYDPATRTLALSAGVTNAFGRAWSSRTDQAQLGPAYFFLRVWDRGADRSASELPTGGAVRLGQTGLQVTIAGADASVGDHWVIAARPQTPRRVVPWELEQGLPTRGPRVFVAPLALIGWTVEAGQVSGAVLRDCRARFVPLTRIRTSACTVLVQPGDSLQGAIDSLPADGGQLCLTRGLFRPAALVEASDRRRVVISGTGPATVVQGPAGSPAFRFSGCAEVEVRSLRAEGGIAFDGCTHALVTKSVLACADADEGRVRTQTCLTFRSRTEGERDDVRVIANRLEVGAWQTGVLVIDAGRAVVDGNRLSMAGPPGNDRAAGQGIVIAGLRAASVQVLDNVVEDAVQGIHVGISHAEIEGTEAAGDVLISRNVLHCLVPAAHNSARHAVFVGNARSTHIKDTVATLRRIGVAPLSGPTPVDGIRVHGTLGPFLCVRQSSLRGFSPTGITVNPLGEVPRERMWLVAETMADGAQLGVSAPETVEQERNRPAPPVPPAALTMAPTGVSTTVGATHCVVATVTDEAGRPYPDVDVVFAVTGANSRSGSATTDATGQAQFCHTGTTIGADTITAFADSDGSGTQDPEEPAGSATVVFAAVAGRPTSVVLSPVSGAATTGAQHCVKAAVRDGNGAPAAGAVIRFSVTGANVRNGTVTTNAAGEAQFCYTGTAAGSDTINAFADIDGSGSRDADEPQAAPVTASWTAPPMAIVPNLKNKGKGQATSLLTSRGLVLGKVDTLEPPPEPAEPPVWIAGPIVVISQAPVAGTQVPKGSAVDIELQHDWVPKPKN